MVTNEMRQPPLRLTRRGRAVLLGLFVLLSSLASAVLFTTASRADDPRAVGPAPTVVVQLVAAGPVEPAPTVVVRPGDTLWSIAERSVPRLDRRAAIAGIRRLNGIEGHVVHPGDILRLPR